MNSHGAAFFHFDFEITKCPRFYGFKGIKRQSKGIFTSALMLAFSAGVSALPFEERVAADSTPPLTTTIAPLDAPPPRPPPLFLLLLEPVLLLLMPDCADATELTDDVVGVTVELMAPEIASQRYPPSFRDTANWNKMPRKKWNQNESSSALI